MSLNSIHAPDCLCEKSPLQCQKCVRESALCIKSYLRGTLDCLYTMQINSVSREVAPRILVQFPHELSTTMFVLIKNLDYRKNKGFISAL